MKSRYLILQTALYRGGGRRTLKVCALFLAEHNHIFHGSRLRPNDRRLPGSRAVVTPFPAAPFTERWKGFLHFSCTCLWPSCPELTSAKNNVVSKIRCHHRVAVDRGRQHQPSSHQPFPTSAASFITTVSFTRRKHNQERESERESFVARCKWLRFTAWLINSPIGSVLLVCKC